MVVEVGQVVMALEVLAVKEAQEVEAVEDIYMFLTSGTTQTTGELHGRRISLVA